VEQWQSLKTRSSEFLEIALLLLSGARGMCLLPEKKTNGKQLAKTPIM
jgi:hypothetical protein